MDVYHGMPYGNIVPVLIRSTAVGTVSVTVNCNTFSATADPSVDDGLVLVNVTGLAPDREYTAAITTPNDSDTITLRTLPEQGEVRFGFYSCDTNNTNSKGTMWQLLKRDVHCLVNIGDEGYFEAANTAFGLSTVDCTADYATAADMRNWYDRYIQARRLPELAALIRSRGYAHMVDDHEYAINNLMWKLSDFQISAPWAVSTADMQMVVDNANLAHITYSQINPPNNDSGIDTGAFYTRFTVGPHMEVFMITSVCAGNDPSDPTRLVRPPTGNMLTAKEETWLLNALATSDRTFKCIASPKMTFEAEFGQDSFNSSGWVVQRDRILQAIHDNSPNWNVPGGCFWVSGDFHTPSVHASYAGVNGATFDHVNVCACPSGEDFNGVRNSGNFGAYTRKCFNDGTGIGGVSNGFGKDLRNVGIVTVPGSGEYVEIEIVLANGRTWWNGRVYAGENKLSYRANRIAV